ncbi:oligosaccharide biosynthesis protein Alg14 like-domain-containing protein [Aspergillus unguis]
MAVSRLCLVFLLSALGLTATSLVLVALVQFSIPGVSALLVSLVVSIVLASLFLSILATAHNTPVPKWRLKESPVHVLVVLGSGGHTAEMFSMLQRMRPSAAKWTYRTYVVSSGDRFSAKKAAEFESTLGRDSEDISYSIVTVPRARRVHQSYLTAPFTTLLSFWSCLLVLCGRHPDQQQQKRPVQLPSPYPDLIITNGPATAVCVILAARLLRLYHCCLSFVPAAKLHSHTRTVPGARSDEEASAAEFFRLRTIFVESWARVKTLSISGKLLLPFADRFLVQWPMLEGKRAWWGMRKAEYVAGLVG